MSKSLVTSSFYNIIYRVLNIIYPLVTMAYIGRVLLADGVGEISLAQNFISYFLLLAPLGIPNYGVKAIGKVQNNRVMKSQVFTELFIINGFSTIVVSALYIIMIHIFSKYADSRLLIILGIQLLCNVFNVDWFYQGIEEYKYISIRSLFVKFLSLVFIFVFVREKEDIYVYTAILVFATIGNYFFNVVNLRKYVVFMKDNISIKKHMCPIIILWVSTIAMEIYTLVDSTMVGTICSKTELAYYSNANRVVRSIYGVLTAMTSAFLPRLSYYYSRNKTKFSELAEIGLYISIFFAIPASVGFGMLADDIIPMLFGREFIHSIGVARIFAILILVFSVSNIAGHMVLIAAGKEMLILKATVVGAVVNVVLNFVLIHYYRYMGAAVSSLVSETIVMILLHMGARKQVQYHYEPRQFVSIIFATIIMAIVIFVEKKMFPSGLLRLLMTIFTSVLVYMLCTRTFGNKSERFIEERILSLFKKL